jgi:hypothetical protein
MFEERPLFIKYLLKKIRDGVLNAACMLYQLHYGEETSFNPTLFS